MESRLTVAGQCAADLTSLSGSLYRVLRRGKRSVGDMSPRARKKGHQLRISTCSAGDSSYATVGAALSVSGAHEDLPEQLPYDDGSQYSLTGGILPALGGHTNRRTKQVRRCIVSPFDCRYKYRESLPPCSALNLNCVFGSLYGRAIA